jgi:hypothetical protein
MSVKRIEGNLRMAVGLLFQLEPMLKTLNPKINDSTAKMMRSLERTKSWISCEKRG